MALGSRGGTLASVVGERVPGGDVIGAGDVPGEADSPANAMAEASTVQSAAPAPRTEFGAVLSSTEQAVFIVGGVDGAGVPLGDAWLFGVRAARWVRLPMLDPAPGRVLAATYRPNDRSLYLIERVEPQGPWGHDKRARLVRIDLRTRASSTLGEYKRKKDYDRIYLSNGPSGELVVLGSSESKKRYTGVRMSIGAHGGLSVVGALKGQGVVARRPTLTERGLTLPLLVSGEVQNEFVPISELRTTPLHDLDDCL
jgi:hypothetical protein